MVTDDDDDIAISVIPDGVSSWVARVDWPDGTHRYREFHAPAMKGMPDVVITDPDLIAGFVEAWVKARPEDWRP